MYQKLLGASRRYHDYYMSQMQKGAVAECQDRRKKNSDLLVYDCGF